MNGKKWIKFFLIYCIIIICIIASINYAVDPYRFYYTNLIQNKPSLPKKDRLVKIIELKRKAPNSIIVGTSRANRGYNPDHEYFIKPSYNAAFNAASLYEIKKIIDFSIKNINVKQILLTADWRAFNNPKMKVIEEFDTYFNKNALHYLFSTSMLKDSILNIFDHSFNTYALNGQDLYGSRQENIDKEGGHLAITKKDESEYYKDFKTNYTYKDTDKNSFEDFEEILKLCYENDVKLDIIFGPSHIRLWEAFAYYHDYNILLQWKKDVVLANERTAQELGKKPFRIIDFSVYHEITNEPFPIDPAVRMKYYWESSHYKSELGDIVLDRLAGKKGKFDDFGVELNITNIETHLKNLKSDRAKFIDTKTYRKNVFGD